jgi:hypothetical protein
LERDNLKTHREQTSILRVANGHPAHWTPYRGNNNKNVSIFPFVLPKDIATIKANPTHQATAPAV